jgi:hypothetical protein
MPPDVQAGHGSEEQYFDGPDSEKIGVPIIAVKYVSTAEQTEDIPAGDKKLKRKRVNVEIAFFDDDVGKRVAIMFQAFMKEGTTIVDALHYSSFLYPKDPVDFQQFLIVKHAETMTAWELKDERADLCAGGLDE